jgi:hypothetical protein
MLFGVQQIDQRCIDPKLKKYLFKKKKKEKQERTHQLICLVIKTEIYIRLKSCRGKTPSRDVSSRI